MDKKIKAILFDMDGVIADTEMSRFNLLRKLLGEKGIVLEDCDYWRCIGKRTKVFLKDVSEGKLSDLEIEEIVQGL